MSGVDFGVRTTTLSDDDISLRIWTAADVDQIVMCCSDPEIPRWTLMPDPLEREQAAEFVASAPELWDRGDAASFAIVPSADPDRVIGALGLQTHSDDTARVGYWVAREVRGRHVATRALRLATVWAFDTVGLERLELDVIVGNDISCRVAEAAGFRHESDLPMGITQRGVPRDGILYARSAAEWRVDLAGNA
jgi:RimJ/RimL family protein N-acetyltransferase